MVRVSEILRNLEARAPSGTAEEWDNVGLLVGDQAAATKGAVVSIDLTEKALQTAVDRGFKLIVNHHPCIFPKGRGPSRLTSSSLVYRAARAGVSVIASHTNFDVCALEVVRSVSEGLGVRPMGRLLDKPAGSLTKLSVFVPVDHVERVRAAVCEAGAGHVGNYDFCTFGTAGEGTFRGGDETRPFLGQPGRLEKAQEIRLETIFPKGLEKRVLSALFESHPYEEVAFDLYPLKQAPAKAGLVSGLGYGFWGEFTRMRPFSDVAKDVKRIFQIDGFMLTDPAPQRKKKGVGRVAFVAGKGASFIEAAAANGCDLFITGEAGYHSALDGSRKGMAVMELGHRESELFFLRTMEKWLKNAGLKTVSLNVPTQTIWR